MALLAVTTAAVVVARRDGARSAADVLAAAQRQVATVESFKFALVRTSEGRAMDGPAPDQVTASGEWTPDRWHIVSDVLASRTELILDGTTAYDRASPEGDVTLGGPWLRYPLEPVTADEWTELVADPASIPDDDPGDDGFAAVRRYEPAAPLWPGHLPRGWALGQLWAMPEDEVGPPPDAIGDEVFDTCNGLFVDLTELPPTGTQPDAPGRSKPATCGYVSFLSTARARPIRRRTSPVAPPGSRRGRTASTCPKS